MITLQYNSAFVALPNPQYPNTNTVELKTHFDHTMDGRMVSYRYTPAADTFTLNIVGISKNKKDKAYNFLRLNASCLIRYTDEEGNIFLGYIAPEDISFEENGDMYNLKFSFRVKERL